MLDACVVDQNVDTTELLGTEGHHLLDLGGLAHVGAVKSRFHTQSRHICLWRGVVAKAVEHHVGALACQGLGDAQADAAGGTRDQGGLAN